MCKIICLQPEQKIPSINLANACYNNWHSYGLITLKTSDVGPATLVVDKKAADEVDPVEVEALLNENIEYFRVLHLRHNTAGASTIENAHPFKVYEDETGLEVYFMHNGTLHEYKPKKVGPNGVYTDDDSGPSDSKNFADRVLKPILKADFGDGLGAINNKLFQEVINKYWSSNNRGILVSNRHAPFIIGDWKTVDLGGEKIFCSNDSYWYKVERGPEHTRRLVREENAKQEAKKKAEQGIVKTGTSENPYVLLREWTSLIGAKHPAYKLKESPANLPDDWDVWTRDCAAQSLPYMTRPELEELAQKAPAEFMAIVDYIFTDYGVLYDEFTQLEEKKKIGERMISQLKRQLENKKGAA